MSNQRLTLRVFNAISRGKVTKTKWIKLFRKDLAELGVDPNVILKLPRVKNYVVHCWPKRDFINITLLYK